MPFRTEPIAEAELDTLADVEDWISDTQRSLNRIPVDGVLTHGATFRDDEYLGDGETLLRFNAAGFEALCQRVGCRLDFLARLESPSLASQVLNDLLDQRQVRDVLSAADFVVDIRTNTVIGLVSKTYVTYSNQDLLTDITSRINVLPESDQFVFQKAYGINTALMLNFVSVTKHGSIEGRGGTGKDLTKLGLHFANSMVGTSSVRINYFLHRLVCANGMMVTAAESVNRLFHSGRVDTLQRRLDRCFSEVVRNLGQLEELLQALGSLKFRPEDLARNGPLVDQIFGVIPGAKQELCDQFDIFLRYPPEASPADKEKMRQDHDARLIGLIPDHFGADHSKSVFRSTLRDGATLFDFINVFTENAKKRKPSARLEIEEKAGALAKYIASNSKKF